MPFQKGHQHGVEHRFKPGNSVSPGRPKTKLIRRRINRFLQTCAEDGIEYADKAVREIFDMSMARMPRESIEWMKLLVETTDGKASEPDDPDDENAIESRPQAEPLNAWLKRATPEHDWDAPHLLLLQEKLEAIERGELKRLIVSMPPRHGKSELLSVHAPVWFLDRDPSREIIAASWGLNLARKFSRRSRKLAEKVGIALSKKVAQAGQWETEAGGGVFAVGTTGGVAGFGAKILIVDDPVKDIAEANSPLQRERVWDWFLSEAMTRLAPGGAVILIMTRRHENDLIGSLVEGRTEEGPDDPDAEEDAEPVAVPDDDDEHWDYVRLPAISEGDGDILKRAEGEALWPKHWPIEALKRIMRRGAWYFAALYQQRPTPRSGGLFQREWFAKYTDSMPAGGDVRFVRYWDKASSLDKDADFTAGVLMAVRDGVFTVCDVIEKKVTPKGRRDLQRACAENDPAGTVVWIEHEGGSSGADAAEEEAKALAGFAVHWEHPTGPKWSRAESLASQAEAGNLILVKAGWNRKFLEQLTQFPNGKHDDMVDAAAGACRKLSAKRKIRMV
jgi:predicted phage terminase large subunit-like protein